MSGPASGKALAHRTANGEVETARLLLRPWRAEDAAELQRLFNDPEVRGQRHLPPDLVARLAEASFDRAAWNARHA